MVFRAFSYVFKVFKKRSLKMILSVFFIFFLLFYVFFKNMFLFFFLLFFFWLYNKYCLSLFFEKGGLDMKVKLIGFEHVSGISKTSKQPFDAPR